jgi:hypothetical protein
LDKLKEVYEYQQRRAQTQEQPVTNHKSFRMNRHTAAMPTTVDPLLFARLIDATER